MNIIEEIIFPVLQSLKDEDNLEFELSPDLILFDDSEGILDSLSLVRFVVEIKDMVSDKYDKEISLSTSSLVKDDSPFKNVTTLSKYIEELINNG